jgi:hypothetical protein
MVVTCSKCNLRYDDARRLTYCPHSKLMSDDDMKQKIAGLALIGKFVCFRHMLDGPAYRVQSVGWNGMVSLEGMTGEFAPHLFVVPEG